MIENFISNLLGGAKRSLKRSPTKSQKKRSLKKFTPKQSAYSLELGTKRKGRDGKMYQVNYKGTKLVWERCIKSKCSGRGRAQLGPSPLKGGAKRKSSKRKSMKRKSRKAKSPKRKSSKRKSMKAKSPKRKISKRKTL